jgi:hypothetical protein
VGEGGDAARPVATATPESPSMPAMPSVIKVDNHVPMICAKAIAAAYV